MAAVTVHSDFGDPKNLPLFPLLPYQFAMKRWDWMPCQKLNIQKMKIMASCPSTSWQIEGEKLETVTDFIFLGSKITVGGDCSHEIQRRLLLGRKAMTDLDST